MGRVGVRVRVRVGVRVRWVWGWGVGVGVRGGVRLVASTRIAPRSSTVARVRRKADDEGGMRERKKEKMAWVGVRV